ncbi:phenylpyruvate tautomerase PptA (4-oxalocrotonate tautomerase family) [Arthrobacter bambusae]|uniref:Phenylpyruvate tautomerase PptA (4-oxalocrotonate tautomerase family) n=2 Tax=Arthrobacter TaxID=1663 RepID=A0AAW8DDT4_9MICC|nr:phenylpyruvate tautomerase PptA (4-oxalocrotonate tautomerase family) [Arthrobacter bambusae]MDQ0130075.1 phenylpyruvate tautomerase PptA (4-oxalocrotonate tautomerase family) [Arthrobacter bambusae]MDQ0181455.1 phenylpyruvate tautomerase PptA (4-oxalocrotonate tautomerase family) [Arthrobacter bambusae]
MSGQTIEGEQMPLVRIDVNEGRTPEQLGELSKRIHDAILAEYGIPERDYFHIITEHPVGQIVAQDAGLGFERSSGVVMIQIFTQVGRSREAKQSLFAAIAAQLGEIGVPGEDVFLGYVENTADDWSFGFGRAQYVTGELAVPAR